MTETFIHPPSLMILIDLLDSIISRRQYRTRTFGFGEIMNESSRQPNDASPVLSPEDQARVDRVIQTGVNATEKKPFRPILLVILLVVVVTGFSLLSQVLARMAGVY